MLEQHSKDDINKISYEILRSSKSLDVFPTPIDKIVAYSELVVRNDIDVTKIHSGYITQVSDALQRALLKIRGVLDRKEKTIYLDLAQLPSRKNFVKLHEVGHAVLPWQKTTHDIIGDDDETLNLDARDEFEAEANFFASATLFQHDRFINEINKLSLSIDSPMQLAKVFGASIHATLRRYVESSKKRCALIVLENVSSRGTSPTCNLRNKFESYEFTVSFGEMLIPFELDSSWIFVNEYYYKRKFKRDGEISLPTDNGNVDCTYQFFCNGYNAFIFIFPVGEKQSSRTKIIITENGIKL